MATEELTQWAVRTAKEIVQREGAELALAARELDLAHIEAESTLLSTAIAKALIEAYEAGSEARRNQI